jgi:hypothetical protein
MWNEMDTHWDDWGAPLRPCQEDINFYEGLVKGRSVLLLGKTPEIIQFCTETADVADGQDWYNLSYEHNSFDCIYGDGVLTPGGPNLVSTVMKYLKPGGTFVSRVFLYNDSTEQSNNFNIAKFQGLGKTLIPVQEIYNMKGEHATTKAYNGSMDIYYFPRLEELCPKVSQVYYPDYEFGFGQYFPIIVWTKEDLA